MHLAYQGVIPRFWPFRRCGSIPHGLDHHFVDWVCPLGVRRTLDLGGYRLPLFPVLEKTLRKMQGDDLPR